MLSCPVTRFMTQTSALHKNPCRIAHHTWFRSKSQIPKVSPPTREADSSWDTVQGKICRAALCGEIRVKESITVIWTHFHQTLAWYFSYLQKKHTPLMSLLCGWSSHQGTDYKLCKCKICTPLSRNKKRLFKADVVRLTLIFANLPYDTVSLN